MKEKGAAVMVEEDERLKEGEELPCFLSGFQVSRYEVEEEEEEMGERDGPARAVHVTN